MGSIGPGLLAVGALIDARPSSGLGHLTRSTALAHALAAHARTTTLFLHGDPQVTTTLRMPPEWDVRITDAPENDIASWTQRLSGSSKVLVVDDPRADASYLRRLRGDIQVIAAFMDGRIVRGPFDVAINGTAYAEELDRTPLAPGTIACFGVGYACLRPDLRRFRPARRTVRAVARRILISVGGADPMALTLPVVRCVARALDPSAPDGRIDVVIGPGFADRDGISAGVLMEAPRAMVHKAPDIGALMSAADLAVSAGGGTLYELAYLGVPTLALPETADERLNARAVARSGACIAISPEGEWETELNAALARTIPDQATRQALSDVGLRLVDGKGPERVAERILAVKGVMRDERD